MDYRSDGRLKCDRISISDAVVDPDELDVKVVAELDVVAVLAFLEPDALETDARFLELVTHQFYREGAAVDRTLELLEEIGQGTDMVLMAVCEHDAPELRDVIPYIGKIRDDAVDSGHVLFREAHAHIDDYHIVPVFKDGHVLTDLGKAAQRDYLELRLGLLGPLARYSVLSLLRFLLRFDLSVCYFSSSGIFLLLCHVSSF